MADTPAQPDRSRGTGAAFATTVWSVVLSAGQTDAPGSREALERLCGSYWMPIYAYLRRRGQSPADAEDLAQGFFASLLTHDSLAKVSPERGRFRSFLLAALRNYLGDHWDRERAQKRGGGRTIVSLDAESAEAAYAAQVTDGDTPERCFERQWAESVLRQARERLRGECRRSGKEALFEAAGPQVRTEGGPSQAEAAVQLGLTENALRVAAFRLRQRYQELVREEIRQTVARPEEIEEEIRHLLAVLSGPAGAR